MTIDYSDKKPFVRIKLDKNGNRIPKREEDSHDGVWHVLFLYYTGDYEKHRNAKKHLAPKTVKEYKYRSGGKERSSFYLSMGSRVEPKVRGWKSG